MIQQSRWFGRRSRREAGFSLVELVVAAFVMSIGILGLAMLQSVALKANSGSRSVDAAVKVANSVIRNAENQGRATRLAVFHSAVLPTFDTNYFAGTLTHYYDITGHDLGTTATNTSIFKVTSTPVVKSDPTTLGGLAELQVKVEWSDGQDATGNPIPRTVLLSRQVAYAKNL